MKSTLIKVSLVVAILGIATGASAADQRAVVLWKCAPAEGKTIKDVHKANALWVKHVNAKVAGGDIQSYVLTPVIGKSGTFMYADSFPSLASWAAAQELKSDELTAIQKQLDAAAKCEKSSLHKSEAS